MPSLIEPYQRSVLDRLPVFPGLPRVAGRLIPLEAARDLYSRVRRGPDGFRFEALLSEMGIKLDLQSADLGRIPQTGPLMVVANHPFGVLDGIALSVVLSQVRSDVKVLTNFLLDGIPELYEHCIFVNPFSKEDTADKNVRGLKQAIEWLRQERTLAVFPAGEVSQWNMRQGQITDPVWNHSAARLASKMDASVVPVYFCGHNSVAFQMLGLLNPRLRTLLLLQEFLQQRGRTIKIRIGNPIASDLLTNLQSAQAATEYLRRRTYLLGHRGRRTWSLPGKVRAALPRKKQEAIAPPISSSLVAADIHALPEDRRIVENADFAVYAARSAELPKLLDELGRLREVTFRAAGEGTGCSRDLDRFDSYYWHLLLWNKQRRELAGAYRAGNTEEIIRRFGVTSLYTHTVFDYDERLFRKIGPALELGRSFVRTEYQRQYAPLLLLWKGIARFVARNPETPVLFGAVSISNEYTRTSREMIVRYFEQRGRGHGFAGLVRPRTPFRVPKLRHGDCRAITGALRDVDELAESISDVESDGKGIPILIKQYTKVGGNLVGFNLDRKFSDVLDGLVIVDLRRSDPQVLERYMGKNEYRAFRSFHQLE